MALTNSIPILLIITAALALVSFILVFFLLKQKPKFPPSLTALRQQQKEQTLMKGGKGKEFKEAILFLMKDKNYIVLFLCYALNVGAFQSLATLVSQLLAPYGYSAGQSGIMGAVVVISGVLSAGVLGKLMDKFRIYTISLFICYALTWYFNLLWSSVLLENK